MATTLGARELKNRLAMYLRLVREGTVVVSSERGRPVAEIRRLPTPEDRVAERLLHLAAQGLVTCSPHVELGPFRRVKMPSGPLSETVVQERENRT
jgi:antitoxin (DNA-binding transcriptional repressor) of toxin-antitoxin stability system